MYNKTKTFGEWWCRKLNRGIIKNDEKIRKLVSEAWDEAIKLKEIYIIIELFPEVKPIKGISNKITSLFKRRKILTYWYNPIKGIFINYKSANKFIKNKNKESEWFILREVIKNENDD